ncbi:hypothetical protein TTMY_0031 [Thermus thermophilus]|uniref:hypothetical protein n=1 Tax=Thermus thermophilus TaxID=274 RepID=UPI00090A15C5|nr:hypothetical protein [Thermus thermophilus]BAW00445.1 hypothetical protein TTMY_0031 [Thermus thermophilus]BDB11168.1 hypothetical protein TthTMY_09070 [Thermus thermophilus]
MFKVKDPEKALKAIALFRYALAALFLLLALLRPEKLLFGGLGILALLMARSGYCPLVRR